MNAKIKKEKAVSATKIFSLGGIEEIGKNTYCIEHEDEIIIVDCGIKFANDELLGIDGIVPNYSYLVKNSKKIKALFITHGHEDHIGGVPYLLSAVDCPVIYAPLIASELIKKKLSDFKNVKVPEIITYYDETEVKTNHFNVSFCRVSHSIPDSFAIFIRTPNGGVLHTGDYRIDFCLEGEQVDLHKLAKFGEQGVTVLMTETTNSEVPGFSTSEMEIYKEVDNILSNVTGRVFFTTFASNLSRIENVIALAINHGRKICLLGRAIETNVEIARKINYLLLNDSDFISPKALSSHPNDKEIMIICTGSQGEEMAALNVIASNRHAWIGGFKPTDTIIFSSNPIPGNWASVQHLINKLYKHGVNILENGPKYKLHASGHATAQEQQLIIQLTKPKYLIPIHGEYKMLKAIQKTASNLFFDPEKVVFMKNGQIAILKDGSLTATSEFVDVTPCFVESHDANGTSAKLINDRQIISEEGIVSVTIVVKDNEKKVMSLPNILTRGCFYACKSVPLLKKISYSIKAAIEEQWNKEKNLNDKQISLISQNICNYYIWRNKKRNPMIISSILHL